MIPRPIDAHDDADRLVTRLRDVARAREVRAALGARPDRDVLGRLGAAVAAGAGHADPLTARLHAIRAWLADDLAAVEGELAARGATAAPPDLAERAAAHLLARGGKRIRPLCALLAARLGPHDPAAVRAVAVAAELTHAATLLHDDVIDLADTRRGAPSARVVYGNSASVLGGDHLLIEALGRVHALGRPALLATLLDAIGEMVAAEAVQLEARARFEPDEGVYHAVIAGKTAALFRWALVSGGALAGLGDDALEALGRAGVALGFAFQLVDDALDLAEGAPTGKDLGADLREGKLTWPLLVACERDPALAARIAAAVAADGADADGDALADVAARIRALGAVEATRERARAFARAAQRELATLPATDARDALEAVIGAAAARRS